MEYIEPLRSASNTAIIVSLKSITAQASFVRLYVAVHGPIIITIFHCVYI